MTEHIQTTHWTVDIEIGDREGQAVAHARLHTDDLTILTGKGTASLSPADPYDVPEIGFELSAGRALVALGERLIAAGTDDLEGVLSTTRAASPSGGRAMPGSATSSTGSPPTN
jgi:hypothetical protein